jgi:hypothetical protein
MAVWGAGDPRWLVENRDDGKNVNSWVSLRSARPLVYIREKSSILRAIVQLANRAAERADHAWPSLAQHWEDKNRLDWSRQRLAELLEGLAADMDSAIGEARLTKLKSVTGEVCQ